MIDNKNKSANKDSGNSKNMGLAIAIGGGVGLVFGGFVFDNAGIGLVVGAGLGIALSSFDRTK